MPHHAAGRRTEPPVSVPIATGARPAATATPEPLEEPPGVRCTVGSHGFRGVPMCVLVPEAAHRELDRVGLAEHDHARPR